MGQFDALFNAAKKAIKNANMLLDNDNTPFNAMYKQYKTLQSLWLRTIEDAADANSVRLEDLCVDLENTTVKCKKWIDEHSKTKEKDENE